MKLQRQRERHDRFVSLEKLTVTHTIFNPENKISVPRPHTHLASHCNIRASSLITRTSLYLSVSFPQGDIAHDRFPIYSTDTHESLTLSVVIASKQVQVFTEHQSRYHSLAFFGFTATMYFGNGFSFCLQALSYTQSSIFIRIIFTHLI